MGIIEKQHELHCLNNEIDRCSGELNLYKGKLNHLAFLSQQKERKEEDLLVIEIELAALNDEESTLTSKIDGFAKQSVDSVCQSEIRDMRKERTSVFLETVKRQITKLERERDILMSNIKQLEHEIEENTKFVYARIALIESKLMELNTAKDRLEKEMSIDEMAD